MSAVRDSIEERLMALIKEAEENKIIINVGYEKLQGKGLSFKMPTWYCVNITRPLPEEILNYAEELKEKQND